jgi:ribonuclease D
MTPEEINGLPLFQYEGPVRIVDSPEKLPASVKALRREGILGFDTESRPAFHKGESYPPSLLQFAGGSGVHLIRLAAIRGAEGLESLLSDPHIFKVGVSLDYDVRKLQEVLPFAPAGFLDLAELSTRLGIQANGIRTLAACVLGVRVSKSARCTNWSRAELTPAQVAYAAADAWISREIYLRLVEAAGA